MQQLSKRESPLNNRAEGAAKHRTERSSIHLSACPPPPPSKLLMMTNLCSVLSLPPPHPLLPSLSLRLCPPLLASPRLSASTRSRLPADSCHCHPSPLRTHIIDSLEEGFSVIEYLMSRLIDANNAHPDWCVAFYCNTS